MAETLAEKQLRLLLERACSDAFMGLRRGPLAEIDFSLFFVDYGPKGNFAFKSTLRAEQIAQAVEALLQSWREKRPRAGFDDDFLRLSLVDAPAIAKTMTCPPGVGYALLVGRGEATSYVATVDRHGMSAAFEEALPRWRDGRRAHG